MILTKIMSRPIAVSSATKPTNATFPYQIGSQIAMSIEGIFELEKIPQKKIKKEPEFYFRPHNRIASFALPPAPNSDFKKLNESVSGRRGNFASGSQRFYSTVAAKKEPELEKVEPNTQFWIPMELDSTKMLNIPFMQKKLIEHAKNTYKGFGFVFREF